MRPKSEKPLDLHEPIYSQAELCEVAGTDRITINNRIHSGVLIPGEVSDRRLQGRRLFSVITIFEVKLTTELVNCFRIPPSAAASIAKKTTDGHQWMWVVARGMESKRPAEYVGFVYWSDECQELTAVVEPMAESHRKVQFIERPLLVLPLSRFFTSIYEKCLQILAASDPARTV
jgi:hypothetical protein